MDEILRFLHTWLTRRKNDAGAPLYPLGPDPHDLDAIIPAVENEVGELLARQRVHHGDEAIEQWLETRRGALGSIEPDIAGWVSGRHGTTVPPLKKAVAFVQLLSSERGFQMVGKIDGRYGAKTQDTLPNLDIYEHRLIDLVQRWLIERSHDIGSESGELGDKTILALRDELVNDERVPDSWRAERRLVAFGQLLCHRYGIEEVGNIDGWLGPSTRGGLHRLADRIEKGPRIGLALSGGGFRASIFHLGVIRRLEELGIMPRVAVISAVSGGSIIAAYYLIEMERRLRSRVLYPAHIPGAAEHERQQRLEVFDEIVADFFRATGHNLRIRALVFSPFFHPLAALKLLQPGFTRADLIQAEYDRWFYRGNTLAELPHVTSPGADSASPPSGTKLVVNTTSLLTGERIPFSREPLSGIQQLSKVNTNVLRLSRVVGASAGVPGLFPPTPVGGDLLVDGGVSDNQGLEGLWSEDCDVLLVSDASGQMERVHRLRKRAIAVLKRTNSIFQFQIREQLVRRLRQWCSLAPAEWEREFAFVHLFRSLKGQEAEERGVPSQYAAALGRIRTDLDEFNPVEREALMYHGYSLIDSQLKRYCPSLCKRSQKEQWAPPEVRDRPALPQLFDERVEGAKSPEEISSHSMKRRGEIKRMLEAGASSMLMVRAWKRHRFKAVVPLVLSWLAPLLLFCAFAWRPLENSLVELTNPIAVQLGSVFSESTLPEPAGYLISAVGAACDRWGNWPVTLRGVAAGSVFVLVNYCLIFFAFSVLRRLSQHWDLKDYARLTGGGVPAEAWRRRERRRRPAADEDRPEESSKERPAKPE